MKDLRAWFSREARRAEGAAALEDALLGGRFAGYAFYRLRYFAARTAVGTLLHAARILLALHVFRAGSAFAAILVLEALTSLVSGFWWGVLEVLRARVRRFFRSGRGRESSREIGRWLTRTVRLAAAALLVAGIWAIVTVVRGGSFVAVDFFLVSIFVRLALDIVSRGYHSGVYAVRRVYRPLWTILGVQSLGFGLVLGLWPLLGAWALPAASIVSSLAGTALTLAYSARAYRHIGISPWPRRSQPGLRSSRGRDRREGLAAGIAYALMRMDGVILIALAASSRSGRSPLSALFLVAAPLVRAGLEWVQLFYFDLKRLDFAVLDRLRASFSRRLLALAIPLGLAAGAAALLVGTVSIRGSVGTAWPVFLLFFTARSELAALQMRAFSGRAYGRTIAGGAIAAAGWVLAGGNMDEPARALAVAIFFNAAAIVAVQFPFCTSKFSTAPFEGPLALPDWLRRVQAELVPVTIFSAAFSPGSIHRGWDEPRRWEEEDRWAHRITAEEAARRLGSNGALALAGPARVVWFERDGNGTSHLGDWLVARSAGLIRALKSTGPRPCGREALTRALEIGLLGEILPLRIAGKRPPIRDTVQKRFRKTVPGGIVLSPEAKAYPPAVAAMASRERRALFADAMSFAASLYAVHRRTAGEVSVFTEDGAIRDIFLLPAGLPRSVRTRWSAEARRWSLRASLR